MFSKMLIFCFCTIGIFALLLGTIDSRFLAVQSLDAEYQSDKVAAEYFEMANVTAQTFEQFYLGKYDSHWETFGLPTGHAIEFWWGTETRLFGNPTVLEVRHTWPGFLGLYNESENLAIIYPFSLDVLAPSWGLQKIGGYDDLLALWGNRVENASYCEWQKAAYNTKTFIAPHNTTRTISESWDDGNLSITVGFTYVWNQTSVNAFELLGQILFFQSPVLGLTGIAGTVLNAMVSIPLWIMIAIIALKLIQSIIPFIKGTDE